MTDKLKQIIPAEFCLQCLGCCRFIEQNSPWIPQIAKSEILKAVKNGAPPAAFSKADKKDQRLNIVGGKDINFCIFLEGKSNKCEIYADRPFDCRLYPFVLEKRGKKVYLSLHLECPFVKERLMNKEFKEYIKYLKAFIADKSVSRFIRENSFLAGDFQKYRRELKAICSLSAK